MFSFFTLPGDIYGRPLLSIEYIFVVYLFTVPEYGTRCIWVLMGTHSFFKYPRWNSGTVPVFDLVLGTKVSTGSVCVHRDAF